MNNTFEYKKSTTVDEALEMDMKIFKAIKFDRLQSLGTLGVLAIVDRLNIEPFYEFLISFNKSNYLPYHNLYHAECVFLNCIEGAYYSELDEDVVRGLGVAALLHDFNHSGGHLPDSENIKVALAGLETAQAYAKSKLLGLNVDSLEVARTAIAVTQYPFTREPFMMSERIIRDADLMQPYEESESALVQQYLGLKAEIEVQRKTTYTRADFASGCKTFQDSIPWHTEWAIEKAEARNWELVKSDLAKLLSMEH